MKLVYFLPLVIILSCSKQEVITKQICDQEIKAEYTIHNYTEFSDLNNKLYSGSDFYNSTYAVTIIGTPKLAIWMAQANLKDICNIDIPTIEFSISFKNIDTSRIVRGYISENGINYNPILLFAPDGKNHSAKSDYHFLSDFNGETGHIYSLFNIFIESKGNFSADSAYFFSNLDYMSCKITAHKPE